MFIPSTGRFRVVSEIFQEEALPLFERGIDLTDTRYGEIAVKAMTGIVPEMQQIHYLKPHGSVESSLAIAVCADPKKPFISFDGVYTGGTLDRVSIETVVIEETAGEPITGIDLCLNVQPRYRDPDPVDIIFGSELCVPFSHIRDVTIDS